MGRTRGRYTHFFIGPTSTRSPRAVCSAESLADYDFFPWWQADLDTWRADPLGVLMGLGERAKPSNSSVSTTRIRPLSGPHWPWMLLQALSALRSGPRLQHLVQLHIRTDCGPQGHQLKNPSTTVPAQFARLQLSQWDRHRGTQCASVRCSTKKYHTSQPSPPL